MIESLDSPQFSGTTSLTFLGLDSPLRQKKTVKAALIITEPGVVGPQDIPIFVVPSIHFAMSEILNAFRESFQHPIPFLHSTPFLIDEKTKDINSNQISPQAVVEGFLEGEVFIGAGAVIGKGSYIGRGTRIEANATILENCIIGRNCVIQSGVVIGCAGFGFFPGEQDLSPMPHYAGVEIGDKCWIGANTVIAAGVLNPTRLGRGCKLDSHVQIAHNVQLGEESLLASQSGIAGSTVIGQRFQMGGAASLDGHLLIGDDVSVAACSGVTKDLADKSVVAGFPARPIREWRREQVLVRRLDSRKSR